MSSKRWWRRALGSGEDEWRRAFDAEIDALRRETEELRQSTERLRRLGDTTPPRPYLR